MFKSLIVDAHNRNAFSLMMKFSSQLSYHLPAWKLTNKIDTRTITIHINDTVKTLIPDR